MVATVSPLDRPVEFGQAGLGLHGWNLAHIDSNLFFGHTTLSIVPYPGQQWMSERPPFEPRSGLDWIMWLLAASSVVGDREACRARHISKMVLPIVKSGPPPRTVDTTILEMWLGSRLRPE